MARISTDSSEAIVLNDYRETSFTTRRRSRELKTGGTKTSERMTIDFADSEALVVNFDSQALAPIAQAIEEELRAQIQAIQVPVSDGTWDKRDYWHRKWTNAPTQRKTLKSGKVRETKTAKSRKNKAGLGKWRARFQGGRLGMTPPPDPGGNERLFNHSGRLVQSIAARANPKEGGYTINVAANRLKRAEFGPGQFEAMLTQLHRNVPALGNPKSLFETPRFKAGEHEAFRLMLYKVKNQRDIKMARMTQKRMMAIKAAVALARGLAQFGA